jgi:hypothetical protein
MSREDEIFVCYDCKFYDGAEDGWGCTHDILIKKDGTFSEYNNERICNYQSKNKCPLKIEK